MKKGRPPVAAAAQKKTKKDTFTVEREEALLAFLLARLPVKGRSTLKAVLRSRQVFVDGQPVSQFDHPLVPGSLVTVQWDRESTRKPPTRSRLNIVFEDADLIVIDKPSGLLTVATDLEKRRTAYSQLSDHVKLEDPDNKIFVVHRLDRETSGLLLFAKNSTVKLQIQENWETTVSQRTYVGVVEGVVEPAEGTIVSYLAETSAFRVYSTTNAQGGKKAITNYRKIGGNDRFSLLLINLETGRKHQIRVHMQDLGHPIVGDKKYGSSGNPIRRIALHAQVLAFTHPRTGLPCRFETRIPEKFLQITAPGGGV
jgi:23S rRNA pseudouridine1911/1915/1917 synthase